MSLQLGALSVLSVLAAQNGQKCNCSSPPKKTNKKHTKFYTQTTQKNGSQGDDHAVVDVFAPNSPVVKEALGEGAKAIVVGRCGVLDGF
jgi:hypothetical protein